MKRKIVITLSCLPVLLVSGWILRAAQQQHAQKIAITPAAPISVAPAKESDQTGKTVAAAKALLATLDDAGRAKAIFPFGSEQKYKWSNFPTRNFPNAKRGARGWARFG